jgi:ABC-type nitrate/sulfonate/bicarbonate transport system ATPase subunit
MGGPLGDCYKWKNGREPILQGLRGYENQDNSYLAIIGRSGCGKSTLLDALEG